MPTVAAEPLQEHCAQIFEAAGAPAEEAREVAAHLVEANLMGHDSHGVIRVVRYLEYMESGRVVPGAAIRVERSAEAAAVVDGGWGFGQVVARRTMSEAMRGAASAGVGVAVAHRCGHVGRLGAYVEQATAASLIGIAMVNNHGGGQAMAAPGGLQRRLSPNPIAIATPMAPGVPPFVLDMTTSVVAVGKVRVAAARGEALPEGWIVDAAGQPSTDPADFEGESSAGHSPGSVLPLGGPVAHKGFGLALAVEALAGALSPAGTSRRQGESGANGLFTLAIDPGRLGGLDAFERSMGELVSYVQSPPYREGVSSIPIPGEPEQRKRVEREARGIEIEQATWDGLREAAGRLGVRPLAE